MPAVISSLTGLQVYFQDIQGGGLMNAGGGTIRGSNAKSISGTAGGSCGGIGSLTISRT